MAQRENKWKEKQYELYVENSKIAQHGSHQKKGEPRCTRTVISGLRQNVPFLILDEYYHSVDSDVKSKTPVTTEKEHNFNTCLLIVSYN